MDTRLLSRNTYVLLFGLLALVYIAGMFVPLMDNDAAHHANIALRMYLTGDYVNLVDYGRDYLDKPHLHFWLSAFSFKIFGVTTFAYKFPSLLFTILGTYSVCKLGESLYDKETGRLSALLIASSFAFILANSDVRMDAILTSSSAFATWQLVRFVQTKRILFAVGAGIGLALAFCTKGHIGVFVPAVSILLYIAWLKEWKSLLNWKWAVMLLVFAIFIFPVVYCYYLQFNLHPEKVVRGKNEINGVGFILLNQSIERFGGEMGGDAKHDYLFFIHTFLWAFAPWSIITYISLVAGFRNLLNRRHEWLSAGVFIVMVVIVSLSGFKLPHYLNIVFPAAAVLTARFLLSEGNKEKVKRPLIIIQSVIIVLLLLLTAFVNGWAFPVKNTGVIIATIFFLAILFYCIRAKRYSLFQKIVIIPTITIAFSFFLLNTNFYPQLLTYQGGNTLARASKSDVDPSKVFFWKETYSSSFNFYTSSIRKPFADTVLSREKEIWLLYDIRDEDSIKNSGFNITPKYVTPDYEITKLDIKFMNPLRRNEQCTKMILGRISRK